MWKREYPKRPIVGVGAVVLEEENVLLVQRKREPGKGQWSLPGGVVKVGESLKEGIKRELLEELSIQVKVEGLVGISDRIIHDSQGRIKYHYIIVDYWVGWISGRPKPGSDISAFRSVPIREIKAFDTAGDVKETIFAAAKMRGRTLGRKGGG